jgi:hypothetical protein
MAPRGPRVCRLGAASLFSTPDTRPGRPDVVASLSEPPGRPLVRRSSRAGTASAVADPTELPSASGPSAATAARRRRHMHVGERPPRSDRIDTDRVPNERAPHDQEAPWPRRSAAPPVARRPSPIHTRRRRSRRSAAKSVAEPKAKVAPKSASGAKATKGAASAAGKPTAKPARPAAKSGGEACRQTCRQDGRQDGRQDRRQGRRDSRYAGRHVGHEARQVRRQDRGEARQVRRRDAARG